jgi:hypothetical protein
MLPVRATTQVTGQMRLLQADDADTFEAVRERIRLIRSEPSHPRALGVACKVPGGPLGRASTIQRPTCRWILVWGIDDDGVALVHLERIAD